MEGGRWKMEKLRATPFFVQFFCYFGDFSMEMKRETSIALFIGIQSTGAEIIRIRDVWSIYGSKRNQRLKWWANRFEGGVHYNGYKKRNEKQLKNYEKL